MNNHRPVLLGALVLLAVGCGGDTTEAPPPSMPPPQPAPDLRAPVLLSEIMYHPVSERAAVERHEFVEIYNRSDAPVNLTGWRLGGEIKHTFPAGTVIPARAYLVIAKDRAALAALPGYQLDADALQGDYAGALDNGGGTIRLTDASGETQDAVKYDDRFPWPLGADALGAGEAWLALLPQPIDPMKHQYAGRSLERASFDVPSSEISNWVPSPLGAPSPGRGSGVIGPPPAIVLSRTVAPAGGGAQIHAADNVTITITFSALGPLRAPKLEYFVDDVQTTGEQTTTVDLLPASGGYAATLPPQPDNAIVRYRILADRGAGSEVISPRPSDPLGWWAYFVAPAVATQAAVYHLFIKKEDWTRLYDNVNFSTDDRRVAPGGSAALRCTPRPSWDARVPAVFVHDGVVYDTFVRYSGSRWNRTSGLALDANKTTIRPLPDRPNPYRVLSWNIEFPAYAPFQGERGTVLLSKLNQSCPGLDYALGERLYGDPTIGIPVQRARYARLHVNGGYYHYMLDLEHIDGDMMERHRAPGERIGDLFKADGNAGPNNVEGPWGTAHGGLLTLNPDCPMWTLDDRYAFTYERMTNKWDNMDVLRSMLEELNALRADAMTSGDWTLMRAFFEKNFDQQKLMDYIAIRNWAQPWDDVFHNYFLYRRADDGKWLLIPQDLDMEYSEYFLWGTGRSFYIGEEGNLDNRPSGWHRVKDAFIKAFRDELWQRIVELDASGVLRPEVYGDKLDEAALLFSAADYAASPAAVSACSFDLELSRLRGFARCRHEDIAEEPAVRACTPDTCGLAAEYYQTAAGDATRDFLNATLVLLRTDARIDFDWGGLAPAPGLPTDGFQVRWTGTITPRYSELYTFYTRTDDGVRLYVDGALVVNRWLTSGAEASGTIELIAGVPVTLTMEYFDATGGALAQLSWSSPSQCKQLVPTTRLSPS